MDENFRFSGTLEKELERLGRRLQTHGFEQRVFDLQRLDTPAPPRPKRKPSLWHKFLTFLRVFAHLPRLARQFDELRHQVEHFKRQTEHFRAALVEATRLEFDAYADQDERRLATVVEFLAKETERLDGFTRTAEEIQPALANLDARLDGLVRTTKEGRLALDAALRRERLIRQRTFTDLDRRLYLFAARLAPSRTEQLPLQQTADDRSAAMTSAAFLDGFYYLLEERYRGTRSEIKDRLSIYRPDLRAVRLRTGVVGPAIDIGCGRGEFLEVMREEGLESFGLDCNDTQLDQARMHGLSVEKTDALAYLQNLADQSVAVISAIHVVEHFQFPDFMCLAKEIERVLMPGGLIIIETPNPRNLIVGSCTFHLDPTHARPLPFEVTEIVLETVGFIKVEFRPLHSSITYDVMVREKRLDPHIAHLLFGPQDYAALAIKH